ncbi:bacterial low temperature requirement A protein-domain-containing protein [Chaetomium strumarium]|uniref:Bacterial low temperature requirement A protein-domain-containing protein n=1 Tax=Chaetomium strumarium TaxID=1170767 RepID=A0AAJ0LYZ1_9PEZI|nr:bacterial low temperature requirement A protein-domain-containing protein [Chaetomium strumarium]
MAQFKRVKTIFEARTKRRIHRIVPWIQNPLQGVDKQHIVFAPRHEASTLELFFDLFFVANLATFTAYHSITDHSSLFAYIGFFAIIWATWFHTVLYDVRFENDSIYSRACKTVMMIVFVGFALVGSAFAPGTERGDNTSFRILCYTLVLSRALFALQYLVVGVFVGRARRTDLYLPLFLNVLTYVVAAAVFAGLIPLFPDDRAATAENGIYSVWWIVMAAETLATVSISCIWRMLSFKKTHLVERMGLLTLIVIGEGAIGVTKTISRLMGKSGLEPEASGLILCIVLILVGTWMIYFDNHPHGHFGTIRQQIWSALHFPIHLAIVGLVEGAQQVALARYVAHNGLKLEEKFVQYCFRDHLDGEALADKLRAAVESLHLDKKLASLIFVDGIERDIYAIGNSTGICTSSNSVANGTSGADFPDALLVLYGKVVAAMYSALGLSIPLDEGVLGVMFESWKLVYRYFWAAFLVLMACFLVVTLLIRTTKVDAFDYTACFARAAVIVAAASILALSASKDVMYAIIGTPVILPLAVGLMYLIIVLDRVGAWIANRRNRRSGDPLIGAGHGDGHDHHGGNHNAREHPDGVDGGQDAAGDKQSLIVAERAVTPPDGDRRISYNPLGTAVMPSYYYYATEPPAYTSPEPTPPPTVTYATGGYVPVYDPHYSGEGWERGR